MTYKDLKDFVLQLLNRYSVAGEPVPQSYNDQADIAARIPFLLHDGLLYLATCCRRLREVAPLTNPTPVGDCLLYQLPDDCYQLCGGLMALGRDGSLRRVTNYKLLGGRQVLLPKGTGDRYLAEYFRYPQTFSATPDDHSFIDCPPEAQPVLAYYIAAHLAMEDSNYLHAALYNEFEMRMLRLQEGPVTECGTVEDVYG